MKIRTLLTALIAAVVAATALAAPAQAIPVPSATANWLTCTSGTTTGTIKSLKVTSVDGLQGTISVEGSITPCRLPDPGTVFGIATYTSSTGIGRLADYAPTAAASPYQIRTSMSYATVAVCLVSDVWTRLACVGFRAPGPGVKPGSTGPISVDDPRVMVGVTVSSHAIQEPGCPTCWT